MYGTGAVTWCFLADVLMLLIVDSFWRHLRYHVSSFYSKTFQCLYASKERNMNSFFSRGGCRVGTQTFLCKLVHLAPLINLPLWKTSLSEWSLEAEIRAVYECLHVKKHQVIWNFCEDQTLFHLTWINWISQSALKKNVLGRVWKNLLFSGDLKFCCLSVTAIVWQHLAEWNFHPHHKTIERFLLSFKRSCCKLGWYMVWIMSCHLRHICLN